MSYHYLVASLPMLVLDEPVPFSPEEFLNACEHLLAEKDTRDAQLILSGHPEQCSNRLVKEYVYRDTQLRSTVARIRAGRSKTESEPFLREFQGYDVNLETMVHNAMSLDNPIERERALDLLRWWILDNLLFFGPFGSFAILGFIIKLKIAYRWSKLDADRGKERLQTIIEENLQNKVVEQ